MNARKIHIALCLLFATAIAGHAQVFVTTTDVTCPGKKNGKATLTVSNAPGPYKIVWTHVITLGNDRILHDFDDATKANGLESGNYKVEVTDKNDCMIEREFEIKEPDPLEISVTSSTGAFSYCGGNNFPDVILYGETSGGTPPRSCFPSSCLQRVTGAGNYIFYVTDAHGCREMKTVHVDWVSIVCASDPNDIVGPTGFSEPRWVRATDPLKYTIRFENDPNFATAPAQHVFNTARDKHIPSAAHRLAG
jgi:hypothetical protein